MQQIDTICCMSFFEQSVLKELEIIVGMMQRKERGISDNI